jgi:DNA helicase-2/ATP-dependent DNA helicase PcrA
MWLPESPEAMAEAVARFGRDARLARDAYSISDGLTHAAGILTFDDMLLFCARHLAVPENAEKWSARWDFVLQDEAQDASPVQNAIARALASGHRNYMIVGDFFQSIYGFRGSDPRLFAAFPAEWNAEVVHMKRNYRSAAVIVEAANLAILGAAERPAVAEPMTAMRPDEGAARALEAEDHDDEAGEFVTYIRARHAQSGKWSDCTALFRTNAQSRALEDALLRERIPYEVVGGVSFYERKEVKDLLAYLRVALGRDRDGDAVRRCINAPFRFLGKAFVDRLMQLARAAEHPVDWPRLVDAAAQQAGIQGRQRESAREWCRLVARVAAANERHEDAGRILVDLIQQTAFIAWLSKDEGEESVENSAAANVRELARVAASFKSADELLDYVEQNVRDRAKQKKASGDRVLLMSVHKSKGLEWPCVWVVGCNDGVLPHAKGDVEEERRLFYVACTRARDELTCSYVSRMALPRGVVEVGPSAFLRDAGLI